MTLTISLKLEPIDTLGIYQALDIIPDMSKRQVFIDDKLVPPALAKIILLGLDVATEQYLEIDIERLMKEGHRYLMI